MALNAFQQAVEALAKQLGLKGAAQSQVYQRPEYQDLLTRQFGQIQLPPGVSESQVITRGPQAVEYKDELGYVHRLERDLSGQSPTLGQVTETASNRPNILPESTIGEQAAGKDLFTSLIENLKTQASTAPPPTGVGDFTQGIKDVAAKLQQPATLAQLSPDDLAQLQALRTAEEQSQQQQFQDEQGKLVSSLYGRGVNRSTIAADAAARMMQQHGLVSAQTSANAAQRQLGLQQFLTQAGQGNLALALQGLSQGGGLALDEYSKQNQAGQFQATQLQNFVSDLLNQALSREVTSGSQGLQQQQQMQQQQEFNKNLQFQYEQFAEQQRQYERSQMWNNIWKGVAAASGIAGGIGSMASGGLFGGGGGTPSGASPGGYTIGTGVPYVQGGFGAPPLTPIT
jgi:hypothetical protein